MDNITQIIATIAGVLTSGAIWKYLENRMKTKAQERKEGTQAQEAEERPQRAETGQVIVHALL